ncbi:MAG: hypothetical protein A2330_07050 [Ignavibacteria bacterium RIFOXYB2_FULL_36_7]|nr:MAG: hypothetical protein A2330_07050 [Ignavibacteria bacterium RIFOXYB2_FULL_36_7]
MGKWFISKKNEPGFYQVEFSAYNLPSGVSAKGGYASGVYFYQLKAVDPLTAQDRVLLRQRR